MLPMTLEQGLGAALVLLFLADIFLTVLYARAGTGLLAPLWTRAIWAGFRAVALRRGYYEDNREDALVMTRVLPPAV